MGNRPVIELFAPETSLTPEAICRIVETFLAAGFQTEPAPGHGIQYWVADNPYQASSLTTALEAAGAAEWGLTLWTTLRDGPDGYHDQVDLLLTTSRPLRSARGDIGRLHLSLGFTPSLQDKPTAMQQFAAWARLLAEVTQPCYGWGGLELGLFNCETTHVQDVAVAQQEPQPLEWLNIYGGAYIERLGLQRLLTAPVWRADLLANGAVLILLSPDPRTVTGEAAASVAAHLQIPLALPAGFG